MAYIGKDLRCLYQNTRLQGRQQTWHVSPDLSSVRVQMCYVTFSERKFLPLLYQGRNKYYGHTSDFSLTESDFRQEWRNIHDIIVELENYLGTATALQDSVNEIKTCSMDPDLEKKYIDKLLVIDELQTTVENLADDMKKLHCVIPVHVKAQHEKEYIRKWREEDSVFLETHGFLEMLQRVREQSYVTFVGVPGSGKSATAQHISLILQTEGYEVVPVLDLRDLTQYCDPHNPQVFVINDVVGVLGVQKAKLESFLDYEQKLTEPSFEKTKVLMTCRETLFNQCHKSFFTNEQNVIKLHSLENALSEDDRRNILAIHGLDRDLLSPALLTESSRMFPLLCKLYSKEKKFKANGVEFFISPIKCILEEFDKMQQRNNLFYASLVLCALNNNMISEDILNDKQNEFQEKKLNVLKSCEVDSTTDTFKVLKTLSAMEGTYTKRRDKEFTFVHDSMFEITAYHFGRQFPELNVRYMKSSYVANNVKLQTYTAPKKCKIIDKTISVCNSCTGERTHTFGAISKENTEIGEHIDESAEDNEVLDLCVRIPPSKYQMLAERLYRDIKDMELHDVFMNDALKDQMFCKMFCENEISAIEKNRLLVLGCYGGDVETVRILLQHVDTSSINKTSQHHYNSGVLCRQVPPLTAACLFGHVSVVKELIGIGADVNIEGHFHTPLTAACVNGHLSVVKELCKFEADVNLESEHVTPLIAACISGHASVVKELINFKAEVNPRQKMVECKVTRKFLFNCRDMCNPLYKKIQKIEKYESPLVFACKIGNIEIVRELLNAKSVVNPNTLSETPLIAACANGYLSVVRILLEEGADVNLNGKYRRLSLDYCFLEQIGKPLKVESGELYLREETPLTAACIRQANLKTDCKDDVVFTKTPVWDVKFEWEEKEIFKTDILKHLLCVSLDCNQDIKIWREPVVKPLLFTIIDHEYNKYDDLLENVSLLLKAGADTSLRLKYREYNSAVDRMGVSALERLRRLIPEIKASLSRQRHLITESKAPQRWQRRLIAKIEESLRKSQYVMKEMKKKIRRYSI
ncbi:uncharacterized protein LOC134243792 [Saccostrea cucullata]|uniref:uncharacterized protein LOC134243792 n=1 Tax=Saccostrea cuccullata TaxID=36930 RepID=UPI002ED6A16A